MRRIILVAAFALLVAVPAQAQQIIAYSNITNFTGFGYSHGGAEDQSGNIITQLAADDIQLDAAQSTANWSITRVVFSVANFNEGDTLARPLLRFWDADADGNPHNFLLGVNFSAVLFPGAATVALFE